MKTIKSFKGDNCDSSKKTDGDLTQLLLIFSRRFCLLVLLINFVFILPAYNQIKDYKVESEVNKAFELRTNGEADEAQLILKDFLKENPNNAMANFEMARLLGNDNAKIMQNIDSVLYYHNEAILNDQDNSFFEFYSAKMHFLKAYISMMKGDSKENSKLYTSNACDKFQNVLKKDPKCKEAYMYLIDTYGNLPEDMGGDKNKAKEYLPPLEKLDPFYAARAEYIINKDSINEVEYWNEYIAKNGESKDATECLAKAYLMAGDLENAENTINEIVANDPSKSILYLDIARAYGMKLMQSKEINEAYANSSKGYFNKYLDSGVDKPNCITAWTYGALSNVERKTGNQEGSKKYSEKAKSIDPNFSRAFAIPEVEDSPENLGYSYKSFFRPY